MLNLQEELHLGSAESTLECVCLCFINYTIILNTSILRFTHKHDCILGFTSIYDWIFKHEYAPYRIALFSYESVLYTPRFCFEHLLEGLQLGILVDHFVFIFGSVLIPFCGPFRPITVVFILDTRYILPFSALHYFIHYAMTASCQPLVTCRLPKRLF